MNKDGAKWPLEDHSDRLSQYQKNQRLFDGKHFEAFNLTINSPLYKEQYGRLKYVMVNFAALVSKVSADMLFGEGIAIKADSKELTKWLNDLAFENKLGMQLYESALLNSALGDDVFKIRSAPRYAGQTESTVIIEEISPTIYYPTFQGNNWRAEPEYQDIAFEIMLPGDKQKYVRVERHYYDHIENKIFLIEKDGVLREKPDKLAVYNAAYGLSLEPTQETGIERSLVVHSPNWRAGRFWGISDYADLESLLYALNNRMTKNENVLDKHTDPILALPESLLDPKTGKVDRSKLDVFTVPDNEAGSSPAKPEYITWNASLENSFKQIEKLVEFLYMASETSPNVFGFGNAGGAAESGRALKLKLIRTIAKINRKKVFYDQTIKEVLYTAQLLAKKHGYKVAGNAMPGEPEIPEIVWRDGLPIDEMEQVELEAKRLDAGIQSKKDALIRIDNLTDEEALQKIEQIRNETSVPVPSGITVPKIPGADPNTADANANAGA